MVSASHRAERKHATVMFADIVGFTALSDAIGAERAYLIVTECIKRLDGIVREHGGAVDKYLGDCLMAVFGHPLPHDDSAGAGVDAALAMRAFVRDYARELRLEVPLDIHVGLNTGPLVAGELVGGARREFHVLGDTVNVAARLKQRSPTGAIFVGGQTREETCDRFEFDPLDALKLKGKEVLVPTFALVGSLEGAREEEREDSIAAEFVGRGPELESLRGRLEALAEGHGGVVALTGPEGVGKSRLVVEWLRSKGVPEITRIETASDPTDRSGSLRTVAGLVGAWARLPAHAEPADRARLLHTLASGIASGDVDLALAFGPLLGLTDGRAERKRGAATDPEPLVRALTAWLRGLARERPVVVVVDDLQDADRESVRVLDRVIEEAASDAVLFVLVSRSALDRNAWAHALPEGPSERRVALDLAPLSTADSERLLESIAEGDAREPAVRATLLERAGGNPRRILLGAFLAPALKSELEREAGDAAVSSRGGDTERRRATVVFADITGFTSLTEGLGDAEAYAVVADALALLDEVARKHGGTVDKYLGDCVTALFGVPLAIEDAPRAAINASIEMRDRIRAFNRERSLERPLDVHTGINTGLAISGEISGPLIREFALMGDPVDVADRLSDLAPAGRIFVGDETHRFTSDVFEYASAEPLALPGRSDTQPVWDLESERVQLHRRRVAEGGDVFSPLVGRDRELETLRASLERAADGHGGVVSLIGEAGLGKSRLLSEVRALAQEREVEWLEGRSLSVGQQLSYHPFADLLRAFSGVTDDDAEEVVPAKLEASILQLFGPDTPEVYPFLASMLGLRLSSADQERLDAISGSMVQRVLQGHVTELVRRLASRRGVVLVFDDLHWADLSSIELIESLIKLTTESPVLLVNVCRPGFADTSGHVREAARDLEAVSALELELEPLAPEDSRSLINNLFRDADIPYETRRRIVERSGGNPLYVEEVVRSLIEEGAVERVGGEFRATEKIHEATLPATVGEVILARFDRLAADEKQVLRVASVIGGTFHEEVLREIFPDKDALAGSLALLQDTQFIVPWDRLQGTEYAFKHPLAHEVVYDGLLQATRQELHSQVGGAIERALTDNFPGYYAMLAYHFSYGRDTDRAEEALFKAGDEAARGAASNEALHFFREASSLYMQVHGEGGDPTKKALLEKNVGTALYNRGQIEEACDHFDRSLEYLGQRASAAGAARQLRFARDFVSLLSRLYLPHRRAPSASERVCEVINVMRRRAESEAFAARDRFVPDTVAMIRELLRVDASTVPGADGIYSTAVAIFSVTGVAPGIGERFLALAQAVADAKRPEAPDLLLPVARFGHHYVSGDWSAEHELDDALVEQSLRDARLYEIGIYLSLVAQKHTIQGRYDRVEHWRDRIDWVWETYEYDGARSGGTAVAMELALGRRDLDAAGKLADVYVQENSLDMFRLLGLSLKATVQTLADDLEGAEATLEKAGQIESGSRVGPAYRALYWPARFRQDLALLERARRGSSATPRDEARAAKRSSRAAFRWNSKLAARKPELLRLEGRRLWIAGDHRSARGARRSSAPRPSRPGRIWGGRVARSRSGWRSRRVRRRSKKPRPTSTARALGRSSGSSV